MKNQTVLKARFEWLTKPRFFRLETRGATGRWEPAGPTLFAQRRRAAQAACESLGRAFGLEARPGREQR